MSSSRLNKEMRRLLTVGAGHIMPGAANALAARMIEAVLGFRRPAYLRHNMS